MQVSLSGIAFSKICYNIRSKSSGKGDKWQLYRAKNTT